MESAETQITDRTNLSPQPPAIEKKEAGIGWGTIFAGIGVISAIFGAVTGLSHLGEQPLHLGASQGTVDQISAMAREKDSLDQLDEHGKKIANGVAGKIDETIRGAEALRQGGGKGLSELGKTAIGSGSLPDAQDVIKNTFVELKPEVIGSSEIIKSFAAGNETSMRYGEGWLLQDSSSRIFVVSDNDLKNIDPRIAGGLIPGLKQALGGMNPNALGDLKDGAQQAERAKAEAEQMLMKRFFSIGAVSTLIGSGLKYAEEKHEAANSVVAYKPVTRIDTQGLEHMRLAGTAKDVNLAFSGGR